MGRKSTVDEIAQAVERAASLDRAVEVIGQLLGAKGPIDRVSIRVLVPEERVLVVAAVWSLQPTAIRTGMRISDVASSLPEVLQAGGPVVVEEAPRAQLLDSVLTSEGIRSWVTAPLRDGAHIGALLSVSSRVSGAFKGSDAPLFTDLAVAIERPLFALIKAAGTPAAD
jgi:GAF domain-containing protein